MVGGALLLVGGAAPLAQPALPSPAVSWVEVRARWVGVMAEGPSGAARWELWRLDDHGNEVLVATFESEAEAERERASYEAKGHKQLYSVRRVPEGSGRR